MIPQFKIRLRTFLLMLLIAALGFGSKYYTGAGSPWVNNSLAGLFYEIFWCLVVFLISPRISEMKIGLWVFIITSMLEFLQLWHPVFLQTIRNTFFGAALLGNSFTWLDFPYYLAGCILGVLMIYYLKHGFMKN